RNAKAIPTRSAVARNRKIGMPDRFTIKPRNCKVLAGGRLVGPFNQEKPECVEHRPERLLLDQGVKGTGRLGVEWVVSCPSGQPDFSLRFEAEKGGVLER